MEIEKRISSLFGEPPAKTFFGIGRSSKTFSMPLIIRTDNSDIGSGDDEEMEDNYNKEPKLLRSQPFVSIALDDNQLTGLPQWALPWISANKTDSLSYMVKRSDGKQIPYVNFDVPEKAVITLLNRFGVYSKPGYVNQCVTQKQGNCFEVKTGDEKSHYVMLVPNVPHYAGLLDLIYEKIDPANIILSYEANEHSALCLKPDGFKELQSLIQVREEGKVRAGGVGEADICILQKQALDIPSSPFEAVRARA